MELNSVTFLDKQINFINSLSEEIEETYKTNRRMTQEEFLDKRYVKDMIEQLEDLCIGRESGCSRYIPYNRGQFIFKCLIYLKGSNVKKLQNALIESGDSLRMCRLAEYEYYNKIGADIMALRNGVIKSRNSKSCQWFLDNIPNSNCDGALTKAIEDINNTTRLYFADSMLKKNDCFYDIDKVYEALKKHKKTKDGRSYVRRVGTCKAYINYCLRYTNAYYVETELSKKEFERVFLEHAYEGRSEIIETDVDFKRELKDCRENCIWEGKSYIGDSIY